MKNATAKPSTVSSPTSRPACSTASGHHRVGEHGEDGAGREGLDEGHGLLRRPAEQRVAGHRRQGRGARRRAPHRPRIQPVDRPDALSPVVADIDSGMFDRNTAATMATPTPPPPSRLMPIAADSGMPSSRAPSTRAMPLAAAAPVAAFPPSEPPDAVSAAGSGRRHAAVHRALAPVAALAVDQPVTGEEGDRPGGQAQGRGGAAGRPVRLLGELEGDGADQHPGAERHDQADDPQADLEVEPQQRPDQQRGTADEPPPRSLEHGPNLVWRHGLGLYADVCRQR